LLLVTIAALGLLVLVEYLNRKCEMRGLLLVFCLAVGSVAAESMVTAKPFSEPLAINERYTYYSLLSSEDSGLLRLGARTLMNNEIFDQTMLDVVAERLWQNPLGKKAAADVDAMAWLAKVLGASGNPRYREMLQTMRAQPHHAKFHKYLDEALKGLGTATATESYQPGTVDLLDLAVQLEHVRAADAATLRDANAALPSRGESLDAIYQRFGLPDYVNDSVIRTGWGIPGGFKLSAMDVYYYNRFTLRMEYNHSGKDRGWRLTHYSPELTHGPFALGAESNYLAHGLMVSNSKMLQSIAIELDKNRIVPREILDVVAERLLLSAETEDDVEVDGLSRLCRVLGRSRDLRYADVLDDVAKRAQDGDLEDYAASFRKNLIRETGERFPLRKTE
jgi:hypothetical protein